MTLKHYLKKAPTLLVIGVTGYAAWPTLSPEGESAPAKGTSKPPSKATAPASASEMAAPARSPFQLDRPRDLATTPAGSSSTPIPPRSAGDPSGPPDRPSDEDQALAGIRLGGTFIDGREQLAVIGDKVYARGERLRGADGSPMPYVVSRIGPDRAVLRKGRRDVVLTFSDAPRPASPRANAPGAPPMARSSPAPSDGGKGNAFGKGGPPSTRSAKDAVDPGAMVLRLLSGIGGASGGGASPPVGSPSSGSLAGMGAASGLDPGSLGVGINSSTLSAGLDALMGKFDDIGRDGGGLPAAGRGTTP